jgi:hypothetical protein
MLSRRTKLGRSSEAGMALIVALLALTLLSLLGITLSVTTSTEQQISANYRWSQQAAYNAEAGLEVARYHLRWFEWSMLLPQARRTSVDMKATPVQTGRAGPAGEPNRSFQGYDCDNADEALPGGRTRGGIGYGTVLDVPNQANPFQNTQYYMGYALNGTFTIWIRRPLEWSATENRMVDSANNNLAIITVEGTAPFLESQSNSAFALNRRAVRVIETTLSRNSGCDEDNAGSAGGGPLGANYAGCNAIELVPGANSEVTPGAS